MKLFNIPLEERQATLLHAFKQYTSSPTINLTIRKAINRLEDIPEVKQIADSRDSQRRNY